jgi:hypothetical protein
MGADSVSDYERGYQDCMRGNMALEGESEQYNNGYSRRYEEEQQLTHKKGGA